MSDPLKYPKLRWPIDIRFERLEKQEILVISCPLGISPAPLGLLPEVAPILSCFDGQRSTLEIYQKFATQGLQEKIVSDLVTLLDKHLFLDSPNFISADKAVRLAFSSTPTRPAALAGLGYENEASKLSAQIKSYFSPLAATPVYPPRKLVGLMAPHIDYQRGHKTYATTYANGIGLNSDLCVLIGTAHQYSPHMFHLTAKHFESPLGLLSTDIEFVRSLASGYGVDRSFADEFLHKREHSLELQVPFMRFTNFSRSIAPILIGSFHHMLTSGRYPHQFEPYEAFVTSLVSAIKRRLESGSTVTFLAGVDMAHVGSAFGDKERLTPEFMSNIEKRDREYLRCIEAQDAKSLFDHIAEDNDRRRICGFPSMYTLLDAFQRLGMQCESKLFEYRQAVDQDRQCAVTFAGLGLYLNPIQAP